MTAVNIPNIGRVNFPDDMPPEEIQRVIETEILGKQAAPSAAWQKQAAISATRGEHPVLAGVGDFFTGASGMLRGALNLATPDKQQNLSDLIAPQPKVGLGDRLMEMPGSENSGWRTAGSFADPAAFAIGGGAAKVLPYAKVLGGSVANAGKAIVKNVAGGAIPGSIIGALSDSGDATSGAGFGAVLNVLAPPAIRAVGGIASRVWTNASTQYKVQAILKDILGPDVPKFKAAMSRAPHGLSAAQAASSLDNDALNALNDLITRMDTSHYFKDLNQAQIAAVVEGLAKAAGGRNQTAIRQAVDKAVANLGNVTEPVAQEALTAANAAGRAQPQIKQLNQQADELSTAASGRVGDVRRLEAAKQTAGNITRTGRMNLGGQPTPVLGQSGLSIAEPAPAQMLPRPEYQRGAELANVAERGSQQAASDSLALGSLSREARAKAQAIEADLAQRGLKPIDIGGLTGGLRRMINDPAIGASTDNERVLSTVASKIEEWTAKNGGVIDARALRTIRTNAINEEVNNQLKNADPKAKAKVAAGLLVKVKPLIDDAIEAAGGKGWKSYLFDYERGSRLIDRQRMAGRAFGMFKNQPAKLESLVAGDEPQLVKKVFKTEYHLGVAMGEKVRPIEDAAALLERQRMMREGGARGDTAMAQVLKEHKAAWVLPNWINRSVAITNRALEEMETRVNKKTFLALKEAMKSGKSANDVISLAPPEERSAVIRALRNAQDSPKTRAFLTGLLNGIEQ